MRDKLKKDPFELVLYAYPEHKFRIFLVTFDSELDVIHDLRYEKRRIGLILNVMVFQLLINALLI